MESDQGKIEAMLKECVEGIQELKILLAKRESKCTRVQVIEFDSPDQPVQVNSWSPVVQALDITRDIYGFPMKGRRFCRTLTASPSGVAPSLHTFGCH